MRGFFHPKLADITIEGVLHALADPMRASIFLELAKAEKPQNCSSCQQPRMRRKPLAKSTLSQHFKMLREAGLIYSEREGVEVKNRTRCRELRQKFGDLIDRVAQAYEAQWSAPPRRRRR